MDDDEETTVEDEREIELTSISAIFPEIVLDKEDPFSASIDLPVTPYKPLAVRFTQSLEDVTHEYPPSLPSLDSIPARRVSDSKTSRKSTDLISTNNTTYLAHLPPLHLRISLPEGYPATHPPVFALSTSPAWLPIHMLEQLRADGERLWEDFGHDQVVFAYIDHLQQAAENAFGILEERGALEISRECKVALTNYDTKAKRAIFERETFDCGICLGNYPSAAKK